MKAWIITRSGWKRRECLWKRRGLAITKTSDGRGWTITHLESGRAVTSWCTDMKDVVLAIRIATTLTDALDWRTISEPFTNTHGMALSPFVSAVLEMFGVLK